MSLILRRNLASAPSEEDISYFCDHGIDHFEDPPGGPNLSQPIDPSPKPRGNLHGLDPAVVTYVRLAIDLKDQALQGVTLTDRFVGL